MFLIQTTGDASSLQGVTVQDWIAASIILGVTIAVSMTARRLTSRLLTRFDMDPGPARLVGRFVAFLIFLGGFVYSLRAIGVAIGPVVGALGVGGLALAFALQDLIANLIAGIMLQTRRPFRIGDQVEVGGYSGEVEDINLRTTVLRTYDGTRVLVPSSDVLQSGIENNTAFATRRTTLSVGVGYDTDLEEARRLAVEAARGADGVLASPAPDAFVEAFGGSSIDFAIHFWHRSTVADMWRVRHAVAIAVKKAFDDADIEIPFPISQVELGKTVEPTLARARTPEDT